MSESADTFRWQTFFQHAAQPVFLLNRRRRILFVNRAWETCTGLTLADVRGRVCRRRPASSADREDGILSVCSPPAEALAGRTCDARRRAPGGAGWWELHFLPLMGSQDVLGFLGTIHVIGKSTEPAFSLPEKLMALRDRAQARHRLDDIDTSTPTMRRLVDQAKLAAKTRVPITLLGEPGTGKAWLARAIHTYGAERQRYFARLDAERLPADLLGDLLFGPRGRQLGLATVYLREPAMLPREWQARLADTLRHGENPDSPRVIVGMTRDPRGEIQAGRLLEELYCVVSPMTIELPPLRERLAELPQLIDIFLAQANELEPHGAKSFSGETMSALRAYAWPGNLCELQGVVLSACRRTKTEKIELAHVPFYLKQGELPAERRLPLDTLLEQVEKRLIALALRLAQGNQTRAAEILEVWRPRLLRRMEKFGYKTETDQGPP